MLQEQNKASTVLEQISNRSMYQASELKSLSSAIFEKVNKIVDRREPVNKTKADAEIQKPMDFAGSMTISMTEIDESTNLLRWVYEHLEVVV